MQGIIALNKIKAMGKRHVSEAEKSPHWRNEGVIHFHILFKRSNEHACREGDYIQFNDDEGLKFQAVRVGRCANKVRSCIAPKRYPRNCTSDEILGCDIPGI